MSNVTTILRAVATIALLVLILYGVSTILVAILDALGLGGISGGDS